MGNNGQYTMPVIDLQEFGGQSRKLIEACEEWGCFRVVNHDSILPASLMSEMKEVVKALFDLPVEKKKKNKHVLPQSGYLAPTPSNPLFEAFGLYDMSSPQDVEAFCTDLDATPYQREIVLKYAKAVHEMMMEIGRKLGEGLELKGDVFEGWGCQFRINKYHFAPENIGSTALQIHTDSGFLTILQDDECVRGLEVMKKSSGEYVAVDPWPGSLIVNLGDMAAVWSNGRFCNVKHRVMCKEGGSRFAIASFLLGPREDAIETPAEFIGSDQQPLYLPITYQQLRNLRVENNMQAGEVLALLPAPHS